MFHRTNRAFLVLVSTFFVTTGVWAQDSRPSVSVTKAAKSDEKKKDDKKKSDEKKDKWLHVKGGDVFPVVGPVQRATHVLVKNGKIHAIGNDLVVPEEAEVLDATGMRVYPGMVAINGATFVPFGSGKFEDRVDPYSVNWMKALAHGITTTLSGNSAVKLTYGVLDDLVLRENCFMGLFYSRTSPSARVRLRKDFRAARAHLRALKRHEIAKRTDKNAKAPKLTGRPAQLVALLHGEKVAVFNVFSRQDILDVCGLIEEFRFKATLRGLTEGWTVPDFIGRSGAMAVVVPRQRGYADERNDLPNGANIENPAILHRHGVRVALATQTGTIDSDGLPGRDALSVAFSGAYAVRGGLPEKAAVAAVTIEAARAYGLDDRIGSLEVGKDADFVVTDGELLHYKTMVQYAVVNGRVAYDKSKVTFYSHVRPRTPEKKKAVGQFWPRPFGEMPDHWKHDTAADYAKRNPKPEPKEEKKESHDSDSDTKEKKGHDKDGDEKKSHDKVADSKKDAEKSKPKKDGSK